MNWKIELTSYIDTKQNIWFKGKDVAKILDYHDTDQALRKHVSEEHQKKHFKRHPSKRRVYSQTIIIDEPGFYGLVFALKLPAAKKIPRLSIFTSTPVHQKI